MQETSTLSMIVQGRGRRLLRGTFAGALALTLGLGQANAQVAVSGSNPFPALPFPARMVLIDADKDGDQDVLYQASSTSGVGWNYMQNNGNGTYTTIAASGTGTFSAGPFNGITFTGFGNMYAVDYDKDGDVDLVDQQANSSRLLVNNGNSTFSVSGSNPFPALPFPARMVFIDADKDGDLDVLYQASSTSGQGWNYMDNNGSGSFTTIAASSGTFSSGPFNGITFTGFGNMYAVDYNTDGDVDLLDQQANSSRLLVNNGNATFSVSGSNPFPALPFPARMVFIDADTDGDPDVIYQASSTSGQGWNYMQNNGGGSFTTIAASSGTFSSGPLNGVTFTGFGNMYVLDYEKDGDPDFVDQQANASRLLYQTNTPPRLLSSTPSNGSMTAVRDANIVLNFSEAVVAGSGNIYIRRSSDNSIFETLAANGPRVTGTGTSTINLNPVGILNSNTSYYVTFDVTAFRDASGSAFGTLPPGFNTIQAITSPTFLAFTTSTVLPVRIVSFTAARNGEGVRVQWQTANESAIDHYEVEYSLDGVHFTTLGRLASLNAATGANYGYDHATPVTGVQYYRLAIYEQDGSKSYTPVALVRIDGGKNPTRLYPVPAVSSINARFVSGRYTSVQLMDVSGRVLATQSLGQATETVSFQLRSFGSGVYYLRFTGTAGSEVQPFNKK